MKRSFSCLLVFALLTGYATTAYSQVQLGTKKTLTLEAAKKLVALATAEAAKNKWTMVIAVVDDGANLLCLERMDGAQIGSIEIAQEKAKTAMMFKRPTKSFQDRLQGGATFILKLPNVLAAEGGVPIQIDNQLIGAIGVSGGSADQDGVVANAALDGFGIK